MVIRVIGLAGILFDDQPLCIAGASGNSSVDVVFFVAASRQPPFTILKHLSADIPGQRFAVALLERLEKCIHFLGRGAFQPGRPRELLSLLSGHWRNAQRNDGQ